MATKFRPKKEKTESLWETLVGMGVLKAIALLWGIALVIYSIGIYAVYWLTKRNG